MNSSEARRALPAVDRVLKDDRVQSLYAQSSPTHVLRWTRQSIDACREVIVPEGLTADAAFEWIVQAVIRMFEEHQTQRLQHVINATGILLHTNLGRAPLPEAAIKRIGDVAAGSNLELDLTTGNRFKRGRYLAQQIALWLGAEDAVIVNNCAAATVLVLQAIAMHREVIISRGQLVEIGGGFRLPEVFQAAGVRLREVGTTNRTYVRDYESALNESTGAVLRVHHSNFSQVGFVAEPSIAELVQAIRSAEKEGRVNATAVINDIGSGYLEDFLSMSSTKALASEPSVIDSVRAGADLTLFSGDKLMGGPQCGLIVGCRHWIEKVAGSPLMRAMRVDKLTLAALEATVEIYQRGQQQDDIPLVAMMGRTPDQIQSLCQSVVDRLPLSRLRDGCSMDITESLSRVGGGAMPGSELPSFAIVIRTPDASEFAKELRLGRPAILGRIIDDRVLLDLRAVADREIDSLTHRLLGTSLFDPTSDAGSL